MPRPVFIICYTLGSEDKETGLLSLFRIIEKLQVAHIPFPQLPQGAQAFLIEKDPMHVVAAWMKNAADDPNDEYEFEMSMMVPGGQEFQLGSGVFQFDANRPVHRFTVAIRGQIPFKQAGILIIENRIRKKGYTDWMRQDYPVVIDFTPPPQMPGLSNAAPNPLPSS